MKRICLGKNAEDFSLVEVSFNVFAKIKDGIIALVRQLFDIACFRLSQRTVSFEMMDDHRPLRKTK